MPKLLAFLPCEKIIVDDSGNASLIVLLQGVGANVGKDGIPKNAVSPKEWGIFTLWQQSVPEDATKTFHQIVQVSWPDGTEFKKLDVEFKMQEGKNQTIRVNLVGFPIGQVGTITVMMWLEEGSAKLTEVYSYPMVVSHNLTQ